MLNRHGWWLTAVPVLAAHWLVLKGLQGLPTQEQATHSPTGPAFQTRSIVPPPSPVAALATAPEPAPRKQTPRSDAQPRASTSAITATPPWTPPDTAVEPGATETSPDLHTTTVVPDATDRASASTPEVPPAPPATPTAAVAPETPPPKPLTQALRIVRPGDTATEGEGALGQQAPPPVQLPAPTRLQFDVIGQARLLHYRARAELVWQHDGARYQAQQSISALFVGSRMQRSTGRISAQGLLPERFSDKSRSEQAAHFDPGQGKVTFSANTPDAVIGPGAQDRLSVFIQVGGLLAAAPERYPTGTQIHLTTVSARAADRWIFTLEGLETLELPVGLTPALKLLRLPQRDYDQKAELWLAPSLGYLPVRIRLTQSNGDFADLQLESNKSP